MPDGRGRGLRQNQSVVNLFNDPAVVAKQQGNPWDSYDEWARPAAGNEQLRNYLTNVDYWGYKGWAPNETDAQYYQRHPDSFKGLRSSDSMAYQHATGGFQERTPEYQAYRRLLKQTGPAQKRRLRNQMKASYRAATGRNYGKDFSLLDQLRFMEERGTNIPWSYTSAPGYDRFNNVRGGPGGVLPVAAKAGEATWPQEVVVKGKAVRLPITSHTQKPGKLSVKQGYRHG